MDIGDTRKVSKVNKKWSATNRQFKSRQSGDMIQEVCFVDVDVWGAQAESCRQYLQKGHQVLIEGRLKLDTWEDPNGQNRSKHTIVADRVVFLAAQNTSSEDRMDAQPADLKVETAQSKPKSGSSSKQSGSSEVAFQDDLPF